MAFKPLFGTIIKETCDVSDDFIVTGDVIIDGSVRLEPTVGYVAVNEYGFPDINWSWGVLFDETGDFALNGWDTGEQTPIKVYNYNGWYADQVLWPKDYVSFIGRELKVDGFGTGEVHGVSYTGEELANMDNSAGWTMELTFYIPIYPDKSLYLYHPTYPATFLPAAQGGPCYIDFDDGTKAGRIWVEPFSAIFMPDPGSKYFRDIQLGINGNAYTLYPMRAWSEYKLYPRTLRLTVKGDEVWITVNSGVSGTAITAAPSPSAYPDDSAAAYYEVSDAVEGAYTQLPKDGMVYLSAASVPSAPVPGILRAVGTSSYIKQEEFNSWRKGVTVTYEDTAGNEYKVNYVSGSSPPTTLYPAPGTPTGQSDGSVWGANGSYYSPASEAPSSNREQIESPSQQFHFHLENAGLANSSGTKRVGINHSIHCEMINGAGATATAFMIDSFYLKAGTDHEGYGTITYSGDFTTYSPECQPIYPVSSWDVAYFFFDYIVSGETYIQTQYWDGAAWQDFSTPVQAAAETGTINLTSVPVVGDASDKLRFAIRQVAAPPSGEAPRVKEIVVAVSPITGDFDLVPHFGPASGQNNVLLTWRSPPGSLTTGEEVWVGSVQVPSGDITDVDESNKIIKMPAMPAGSYQVKIVGSTYWSIRPYTYVDGYNIEADVGSVVNTGELELVFGNTRSPFRIVTRPPDHAVILALLGTTPMDVGTHMSLINLADREPANLTGYGVNDTHLYNGVSGDFNFDGTVDSSDILVSNRAVMRRNLERPTPLYYKYLIGRDRYYVHVPAATGATDIEAIRSSITVYEDGGATSSVDWDVIVSSTDYNGDALPDNIYSVIILTADLSKNTQWVSYRGADRLSGYVNSGMRREIINPVPLFDDGLGRMNMSITPAVDGSYNVSVEV